MSGKIDKNDAVPGLIEPNVLYTLGELKRRTKLGDWAVRKARRAGLKIRKIGNQRFVFGRDFHAFVEDIGTDSD